MSRWIDADELIKHIKHTADLGGWIGEALYQIKQLAIKYIDSAPSIDIVRCKECKHWEKYDDWSACNFWSGDPYEQATTNADDFCSYGERKDEPQTERSNNE